MPAISVIVPVYKVESYIHRCIKSILNQTIDNFELILVDDGSPDNCGKICDEYAARDKRVVVIHKKNGGLSDARNAGIDWVFENSDSEWLTFVDSDDWVHSRYLEILFDAASKNEVSLSTCGHKRFENEELSVEGVFDYQVDVDSPENMLKKGYSYFEYNFTIAWGRLYNKELLKHIRYPVGRLHEDEFVTYRLIYACDSIAVVNLPLYFYFQNGEGIMASHFTSKRMADSLLGLRKQIDFFYKNKKPQSFCKVLNYYRNVIVNYKISSDWSKEHRQIVKSVINDAKDFEKLYTDYLPPEFWKYGFKKYLLGKDLRKKIFKCDFKNIKRDNGVLRATLWAVKNYWKF